VHSIFGSSVVMRIQLKSNHYSYSYASISQLMVVCRQRYMGMSRHCASWSCCCC